MRQVLSDAGQNRNQEILKSNSRGVRALGFGLPGRTPALAGSSNEDGLYFRSNSIVAILKSPAGHD
jgi:hypothetical protein